MQFEVQRAWREADHHLDELGDDLLVVTGHQAGHAESRPAQVVGGAEVETLPSENVSGGSFCGPSSSIPSR